MVSLGVLLAVGIVLSMVEHSLPPLPLLPPGVKLGLSNIVAMFCVFFLGKTTAVAFNASKSLFVFLTGGPFAGILSLCGGLLSIGAVILLVTLFRNKISYVAVSVAGAIAHNLGQYAVVSLVLSAPYLITYLPVLLVSGAVMGVVTGTLMKVVLPALKRISAQM